VNFRTSKLTTNVSNVTVNVTHSSDSSLQRSVMDAFGLLSIDWKAPQPRVFHVVPQLQHKASVARALRVAVDSFSPLARPPFTGPVRRVFAPPARCVHVAGSVQRGVLEARHVPARKRRRR